MMMMIIMMMMMSYSATFMFRGDQWLSYDNERSIQAKTEYAHDQGLAGVMTWSIDTDDFLGVCNGPKFPLLRTINHALSMREQGIYSKAGRGSPGWLVSLATILSSA